MSVGARGVFPWSLETPGGSGGGGGRRAYCRNGAKKRNKSVAKWEYASWCVLSPHSPHQQSLVRQSQDLRACRR